MDLKEIQERNYQAAVKRELIYEDIHPKEFALAIYNEATELLNSVNGDEFDKLELADVQLVILSFFRHFNIPIELLDIAKTNRYQARQSFDPMKLDHEIRFVIKEFIELVIDNPFYISDIADIYDYMSEIAMYYKIDVLRNLEHKTLINETREC